MTFLNPILATLGLLAIALPIIIHILMRRRRKPVAWAAMRFLLEAYQQQRRRLRLEQILLLATRCLLVALIALAIGRPILGALTGQTAAGPTTLLLLIDNSLASAALDNPADPNSTALTRHKARARDLLAQLDDTRGDRAALITLAGPAEARVYPPTADLSALAELIETLAPLDSAADLPGALAITGPDAASAAQPAARAAQLVLLSDLRQGTLDAALAPTAADPASSRTLLAARPAEAPLPNITVTAVEPLRPVVILPARAGGASLSQTLTQAPVRVTLKRSGDLPAATITVRLAIIPAGGRPAPAGLGTVRFAQGQPDAVASIVLDSAALAQQTTEALAASAILQATIETTGPIDALAADNTFRRPIELRQSLRVGLISTPAARASAADRLTPADWFRLALQTADAEIEIVELDPAAVDAPRLAALDAAICPSPDALTDDAWRRLRGLVDAGGLVLIAPPPAATVHTWPDQLTKALAVPWQVAREARTLDASITPRRTIEPQRDLLALLAPELEDLARPITITKLLPVSAAPAEHVILATVQGDPLLLAASPAAPESAAPSAGLVALLTVAPSFDWTNLQAKPLMVPLVQELVRQGVGRARPTRLALAGSIPTPPPRTTDLRTLDAAQPVAPGAPVRTVAVLRALDERGGLRGIIAINPDPAAARLDTQPIEPLAKSLTALAGMNVQWLEPQSTAARPATRAGSPNANHNAGASRLVLGLLIAAIALAVLDAILSRWFTHATPKTS